MQNIFGNAQGALAAQAQLLQSASNVPTPIASSVSAMLETFDPIIKRLVELEERAAGLLDRVIGPTPQPTTKEPGTVSGPGIIDGLVARRGTMDRLVQQLETHLYRLHESL